MLHSSLFGFAGSLAAVLATGGLPASVHASAQGDEETAPIPYRVVAEIGLPILDWGVDGREKQLVAATKSGVLHAWNLKKEKLDWELKVTSDPLTGFAVGDEIAVFTDGEYAIPDAVDLKKAEVMRRGSASTELPSGAFKPTVCLVLDPEDRWVWFASTKGHPVRMLPSSNASWSQRFPKNDDTLCMALGDDGDLLAFGGRDHSVRFLNSKSASLDKKKVLEGHASPVTAVAFAGKKKLVSASEEGVLRVWKLLTEDCEHVLEAHEATVRSLACDPKGDLTASGDVMGNVLLWDVDDGVRAAELQSPGSDRIVGLRFLDKGKELFAASGSRIVAWDVSDV